MLITLHKHLYAEPLIYLTRLIFQIDINSQNEQILQLSALLTKFLWSSMLDIEDQNSKQRQTTRSPVVFQPLLKHKKSSTSSTSSTTDYDEEQLQVQTNKCSLKKINNYLQGFEP